MALILAIDPKGSKAARSSASGVSSAITNWCRPLRAPTRLAAIDRRLPDLVLLSPFLPEAEEGELLSRLRARSGARDVRALTIPILKSAAPAPAARSGRRGRRRGRSKDTNAVEGCEPRVFADRIREVS